MNVTVTCAHTGASTNQGATTAPMAITVNGRELSTRRVKSVMLHLSGHKINGLDVRVSGGLEVDLANDAMLGDWITGRLERDSMTPVEAFRAALEQVERRVDGATTCEEAMEVAAALQQCWYEWGSYGAWRADTEVAWQRVVALAVKLPALPMENPWRAARERLRREMAAA